MCTYNQCRGNKRKGLEDFWEAKPGLTRMIYGRGRLELPHTTRAALCGVLAQAQKLSAGLLDLAWSDRQGFFDSIRQFELFTEG